MELKFYLEGMEIKQYFTAFYGPDLINIRKINENFYNIIFKDLGIAPNQSIVIDDNPYFLKMAEKSGRNVIQACLTEDYLPQFQ
jgi:FMN phosphatase YigB (HAD superfamily)